LNGINWQFIHEYPFAVLNEWLRFLRDPEDLERFRRMRQVAVHNVVLFLVVTEGELPPYEAIVAASLSDALKKIPLRRWNAEEWAQRINARFDREAAAACEARIPLLEAELGPAPLRRD
jgi:hypothetical protein